MNKIAKFEKVSFEQFSKDFIKLFNNIARVKLEEIYNSINIPSRATRGSAGYDFYSPVTITLEKGETINIPTGIRCKIKEYWFLGIFPRSSLGFKYSLKLNNTVGIIDSDYFYSDNEGHIFIKITNDSPKNETIIIEQGKGFAQGIFIPFGITIDDNTTDIRNGGIGSTKK